MTPSNLTLAGSVALGAALSVVLPGPGRFHAAAAALLLFAGLELVGRGSQRARIALAGGVSFFGTAFGLRLLERVRHRLLDIREWDFVGFWLHARSALAGKNFYDPQSALPLAQTLELSEDFHTEIVNVGFWYPPPSMFFFLPAGLPDLRQAIVLWYALSLGCLVASGFVLWRTYFAAEGALSLGVCSALMLACDGVYDTVDFGQTSFLLLLFFSLFLAAPARVRAGVFVGLAALVKPFVASVFAVWVLARRPGPVLGFAATAVVTTAASVVAFGTDTFVRFFAGDSGSKPLWIYSQGTNQSALGFLHRRLGTGDACSGVDCVLTVPFVAFVAVASAVTLLTVMRVTRHHQGHDPRNVATLVLYALMVYPVSQSFYSVLVVPLLLGLWSVREQLVGGWRALAVLAALDYLVFFGHPFVAYALTYAAVLAWVWWPVRAHAGQALGASG